MDKFFVCTFGCRCNQADSAAIASDLRQRSMGEADAPRDADLIVVNTCTVTHRADQQARQAVRRLSRENPSARIVVTGCYAEREPLAAAAIHGVSLVVGNGAKARLGELVSDRSRRPDVPIVARPPQREAALTLADPIPVGTQTRPLVKLQDGCDARCSYCIVPRVRGPGRSVPPEEALRAIRGLVERGYQEIVLTGVNLGSYGRRLAELISLTDLLRRILEIPGLGRVRLSSIEPMRFNREVVRLAAGSSHFARHFHFPLQSGSDRVLRRMRRPYRAGRVLDLLRFIAAQMPDAGLGADVMVGFPGESEDDFRATLDLLEQAPLSYLHVFPFSARPGTDACALEGRVPPAAVRDRVQALRVLSQGKNLEFRRRFVGRRLPAITLAKEEGAGTSVVLTDNYIHARVPDLAVPPNRLVRVRILEAGRSGTAAALDS